MNRLRHFVSVALAALSILLLCVAAEAAVTSFTGTITTFVGTGSGLPAIPIVMNGGGAPIAYSPSGFSLSSGAFTADLFSPIATNTGGTVPVPTAPNSIYLIGQIVNASSQTGTLSAGSGPSGGFGGSLGSGINLGVLLGLAPLPASVVFGSIQVPVNAGLTGTATASVNITGNVVSVSVIANGWTTGVVTYDDRNAGTLAPGGTPIPNAFITSGTVTGTNNLGPNGGTITLVTPFVVRVPGTGLDLRAGYSVMQLTFIPEPSSMLLLGGCLLLAVGWIKHRP